VKPGRLSELPSGIEISPILLEIVPQEQLHNVLCSGAPYVSQIGLPFSGTVGVP
jgi:hypothetical protein